MRAFKLILFGFWALLVAAHAPAQTRVVEFFDAGPGHFFMTADPKELEGLASRTFGPSFIPTGFSFDVLPAGDPVCVPNGAAQVCSVPVCRFHYTGPVGPADWFFYTARAGDCAILRQPGSGFEDQGTAFQAFLPLAGGTCPANRVPVYRSYRNQNHRFTADRASHLRGVAAGALDEGVDFCAEAAHAGPVFEFPFRAWKNPSILTEDLCPREMETEGCVAARNLVPPRAFEGDFDSFSVPQPFVDRTGFRGRFIYTEGDPFLINRASRSFVQFADPGQVGLNVNYADSLVGGPSALDLAYALDRFTPPFAIDNRLFPFLLAADVPLEISMRFTLFVNAVNMANGSRFGGRLRLNFADEAGRPFDLVVPLYGDQPIFTNSPLIGADRRPVLVGQIDQFSLFGHQVTRLPFLQLPPAFRSVNPWGFGGVYDFRINGTELQQMVNAVRAVDPRFLREAALYQVRGYRIENEVDGPGSVGLNAYDISLQVVRR